MYHTFANMRNALKTYLYECVLMLNKHEYQKTHINILDGA